MQERHTFGGFDRYPSPLALRATLSFFHAPTESYFTFNAFPRAEAADLPKMFQDKFKLVKLTLSIRAAAKD